MGALLTYSLIASLFLMLLYPVARGVVDRSTDFQFNRIFLLFLLGLCVILPLAGNLTGGAAMTVNVGKIVEGTPDSLFGPLDGNEENSAPAWVAYIIPAVVIYILGVFVMLVRETFSYLRLSNIIRRSERIDMGDYTLCRIPETGVAPFSWGRYIFLSHAENGELPDEILLHEQSHIEHRHWIDVLLCDIACILLWYNPFAWKTRRLVKLNHEFQADSDVIVSGIDPYAYQRLLLTTAMDRNVLGVANCFGSDRRGFRKRVLAIGDNRPSRRALLISLWAIPVLVAGVFVTSFSLSSRVLKEISMTDIVASNLSNTDEKDGTGESAAEKPMAEFEGGETALYYFLAENMVYPEVPEQEMSVKHTVKVVFDVTKDGHVRNIRVKDPKGNAFEEEACRMVRLTDGKWRPAVKDGKPVDSNMLLPFIFKMM